MTGTVRAAGVAVSSLTAAHKAMLYMTGFVMLWAGIEFLAARPLALFSPYQVVWTRYGVHLVLMLLIWGRKDPARLWRTQRRGYQLARSMLMLAMPASWVLAMQSGVAPNVVLDVFWISPLLILGLSWLLLKERPGTSLWIATGVAFCGAYLLHGSGNLMSLRVLGFPLAMALSFSLYVVMTRSLRSESTIVNLFYTAFGVFLALTPAMPTLWKSPGPREAITMVAIGLFGWLALWMLDRAAAEAPVPLTAPFAFLQPAAVAAVVAAIGVVSASSPRRMALGALLVGAAVVYVWQRAHRIMVETGTRHAYTGSRPTQEF